MITASLWLRQAAWDHWVVWVLSQPRQAFTSIYSFNRASASLRFHIDRSGTYHLQASSVRCWLKLDEDHCRYAWSSPTASSDRNWCRPGRHRQALFRYSWDQSNQAHRKVCNDLMRKTLHVVHNLQDSGRCVLSFRIVCVLAYGLSLQFHRWGIHQNLQPIGLWKLSAWETAIALDVLLGGMLDAGAPDIVMPEDWCILQFAYRVDIQVPGIQYPVSPIRPPILVPPVNPIGLLRPANE